MKKEDESYYPSMTPSPFELQAKATQYSLSVAGNWLRRFYDRLRSRDSGVKNDSEVGQRGDEIGKR